MHNEYWLELMASMKNKIIGIIFQFSAFLVIHVSLQQDIQQ